MCKIVKNGTYKILEKNDIKLYLIRYHDMEMLRQILSEKSMNELQHLLNSFLEHYLQWTVHDLLEIIKLFHDGDSE